MSKRRIDSCVLFVCYGQTHVPDGIRLLQQTMMRVLPNNCPLIGVIDNQLAESHFQELSDNMLLIGGNNYNREFSGWDCAIRKLSEIAVLEDNCPIVLANDSFHRSYGTGWLSLFTRHHVERALKRGAIIGWIDRYPKSVDAFGGSFRRWIRTNFFIMNAGTLAKLTPLAISGDTSAWFGADKSNFFSAAAPLSLEHRQYISDFLFGLKQSSYRGKWHSQKKNENESIDFFRSKALSIISEHRMSAAASALGIPLYDVRHRSLAERVVQWASRVQ